MIFIISTIFIKWCFGTYKAVLYLFILFYHFLKYNFKLIKCNKNYLKVKYIKLKTI
jgi:hypothetical protein